MELLIDSSITLSSLILLYILTRHIVILRGAISRFHCTNLMQHTFCTFSNLNDKNSLHCEFAIVFTCFLFDSSTLCNVYVLHNVYCTVKAEKYFTVVRYCMNNTQCDMNEDTHTHTHTHSPKAIGSYAPFETDFCLLTVTYFIMHALAGSKKTKSEKQTAATTMPSMAVHAKTNRAGLHFGFLLMCKNF